ncbi:hypothetical protein P170DRAFT_480980 [Aspergillus steynii IBT 23096]|uniref:Uncharacterized protein n=1 Tax=Aspergillus steynii IBT 23096 TaxID=1392250 RepID=A0A2I2FTX4_9EURO|nr:uncharacterized protein P170DRAFT_480980 [Aspergillus steynii IBT 23096]PLB44037.1 hypothetical protein P170DRAFT_480980 [Aspergillus steynii IBT 23096]
MSAESAPITPSMFAEAIQELSLSVLYAKVSELRNSVAHLQRSNDELKTFVLESCDSADEKRELESYIAENEGVMTSMTERIALLKAEVERRGQQWIETEEKRTEAPVVNGANGASAATTQPDPSPVGDGQSESQAGQDQEGVYL